MKLPPVLRRLFGRPARPASVPENAFTAEQFIYIKIPAAFGPVDRATLFEDPIDLALAAEGSLGAVSGGGSLLSKQQLDGSRHIEFCGIDVDTTDRDRALGVLRKLLPTLNAPLGTELHYTAGVEKLQDELSPEGWLVSRPRLLLHPGFGI